MKRIRAFFLRRRRAGKSVDAAELGKFLERRHWFEGYKRDYERILKRVEAQLLDPSSIPEYEK